VYGKVLFYVKDPQIAKLIQGLTGKKTIDQGDMDGLKAMGMVFEEVIR
jgi:hypothetical protein